MQQGKPVPYLCCLIRLCGYFAAGEDVFRQPETCRRPHIVVYKVVYRRQKNYNRLLFFRLPESCAHDVFF